MSTSFEVSGGPYLLSGNMSHADIHEVTNPTVPTNIIRIDQDWCIHLQWQLTGSLVRLIDGEWLIQTYLESIGQGFEGELNPVGGLTLEVNPGSPNYDFQFPVNKGQVPVGSYKLVTTIKYRDPTGLPGPITGFYEEPLVEFYDAGP